MPKEIVADSHSSRAFSTWHFMNISLET